jgi:hypothetical protein
VKYYHDNNISNSESNSWDPFISQKKTQFKMEQNVAQLTIIFPRYGIPHRRKQDEHTQNTTCKCTV